MDVLRFQYFTRRFPINTMLYAYDVQTKVIGNFTRNTFCHYNFFRKCLPFRVLADSMKIQIPTQGGAVSMFRAVHEIYFTTEEII